MLIFHSSSFCVIRGGNRKSRIIH